MKLFSFCIYGNNKKYTQGLVENLEIINRDFPEFYIWIYCGNNVPAEYIFKYRSFKNTKLILVNKADGSLMVDRFFSIDSENVELCFVRDADSRINDRDKYCIKTFMSSNKLFHIIRDHPYHGMRIMGGMWGSYKLWFKIEELYLKWKLDKVSLTHYQNDQEFLRDIIYPLVKNVALIQTNYDHFGDEDLVKIDFPADGTNFVGNVLNYRENGENYFEFSL